MLRGCDYKNKSVVTKHAVELSWNLMAHGDTWRGSEGETCECSGQPVVLHSNSEHGVSSITTITTADAYTSAASSRPNWPPPHQFKWTHPFRWKTKSGFCMCAITFQTFSMYISVGIAASVFSGIQLSLANSTANTNKLFFKNQ